ncbi:XRE family transcriptional regulator [Candidatus Enterovibrio escicola]|uniref:Phage repressor n=1 Tax=Candidatus Enterovibrio escicola TaxID=1927127 RepID=A0A2A5T4C1_9GAMM|nr:XRE family transcriptional regulator [Candidatus Enterovibrio escacola]PCS23015.1 Phage repressor [Candidatus Enterovibrio escacola]
MSIAERIKEIREQKLNLSKKELAGLLNISQTAVNQWEKGVNLPAQKNLIKLSKIAGVSYEWLIQGQISDKTLEDSKLVIPFYRDIEAIGRWGINCDSEVLMISSHLIPIDKSLNKNVIALLVSGDSMEPAISDNGIVFVDTSEIKITDGRVFVYQLDNRLRIKRIEFSVNGLIIKNFNSSYNDERVSLLDFKEVKMIGRVIYSINRL